MTLKKLTGEQVKAIKKGETVRIPYLKAPNAEGYLNILVSKIVPSGGRKHYWAVRTFDNLGDFSTAKEAITFIEHLLNQRCCWLPENNGWIMSGEIINLTNAGKVMELMSIAEENKWYELKSPWFYQCNNEYPQIFMTPKRLKQGVIIPADSRIWDAVKGVE